MPTFNPDVKLLERAIRSIVLQTYPQWVLHIVRDGGTMDDRSVIALADDERIRFHRREHYGKANALNYGLQQGNGHYVAYLDDDDCWYANHLEEAISTLRGKQARIVHTDVYEVFVKKKNGNILEISRNVLNRGLISDLMLWYVSHINVVHERSLIEQAGPYDESRKMFIDWDMLLRMSKLSRPIHHPIVTGEHFIYLDDDNRKVNTISHVHDSDPHLSKRMHDQMLIRAFELLSPQDFVHLAKELLDKTNALRRLGSSADRESPTPALIRNNWFVLQVLKMLKRW